jgi:hypothetical protein
MPILKFDRFDLGELTKPGATDVPLGGARVAKNVNFSSLGQLLSQKGNLLTETGPTGVVLESGIRYEWNLPSPFGRKKTWIVHGKDGSGRDELWWKPYWNPETAVWVEAWQELTEFEGPYTMESGSTTTKVRDVAPFQILQSSTNYYKTWVLFNVDRQKMSLIDSSSADATNRDLNLIEAIASQASGDKFLFYRFSLFLPIEGGYNADAGSNDTNLIDDDLKAEADDYYNSWTLHNTTRIALGASEVTISDYELHLNKLVHPTVSGQSSGDSYYVYTEDHDIKVNSQKVRFFPRFNAVEISLGNDKKYPIKAPFLFQFISARWFFENTNTFEGFWLSRNVIARPDINILSTSDPGTGTLAQDVWYFKISYIYDGYQESSLSDSRSSDNATFAPPGSQIQVTFFLPYGLTRFGVNPGKFDSILNRRVTHIKIYTAKGQHGDANDDYFLWAKIPIVNLFFQQATSIWKANGTFPELYDINVNLYLTDEIWNGTKFLTLFNDAVLVGRTLRWEMEQGHRSKTVHANYKFRSVLQEQVFKSPVFTDEKRDAACNFSVQANSDGVPADDVIPIQNIIDLAFKGVTEITGSADIGGALVILTPNRIFVYEPGIQLGEFPIERGSIAPESILVVGDSVFFASTDDIYEFNLRSGLTKLMFGKNVDQWEALTQTNKENTVAGYIKKTNSLWFLAGGTIFIYDLDYKSWRRHTTSITPVFFAADKDQTLFAITASEIYELESDLFTETINIDWESNVVDFSKESNGTPVIGNAVDVEIKFSGERQVSLLFYDTEVSETIALRTLKFYKSGIRRVDVEMAKFKLGIKTTGGGSSQPKTAIDSVLVNTDLVRNG